jgi:hypothetical protein
MFLGDHFAKLEAIKARLFFITENICEYRWNNPAFLVSKKCRLETKTGLSYPHPPQNCFDAK